MSEVEVVVGIVYFESRSLALEVKVKVKVES